MKRQLDEGTYKFKTTNNFKIMERGKVREIKAHHISDRAVLKSLSMYSIYPTLDGMIMENNSASQKGKGTDHAIKVFREALAHAYKKYGREFYVGTYDFHDYFGSIPHDKAIEIIGSRLDERSRQLFIDYTELFDEGYGIGGEVSQIVSIAYPSSLDREIACDPAVDRSGRYMDDGWFITGAKEDAVRVMKKIQKKAKQLGLVINETRTDIANMSKESVTFLKKRTSVTETGQIVMKLTRKNIRARQRATKKQKEDNVPPLSTYQSLQSWFSYSRKYRSDRAKMSAAKKAAVIFGINWDDMKILMRGGMPNGLIKRT